MADHARSQPLRSFVRRLRQASAGDARRLRTEVAKGGVVLMVRQLMFVIFSAAGALVTTRIIGPSEYGIYVTALSIHLFVAGVFGLGVQAYLIRGPETADDRVFDIASTFLVTLGVACGLGEAALVLLVGKSLGIGAAIPILVLMATTLAAQLAGAPALARLDRQFEYERAALVDLAGLACYYTIAISLAFLGWGAWALATGWTAQQAANLVGYHLAARWCPRRAWDWGVLRKMVGYSTAWAASGWIWQARSLVNPLIVGNLLGIEAVGFVSLAQRLVDMVCFTRPIAWRVAMAAFARVQNEPRKLVRAIEDGMELQALAIGPPLIIFAAFGRDLVGSVFGERWLPAFAVYPFVALASFGIVLFTLHSSALSVYGRNLAVALANGVGLVVFATGTYLLISTLGVKAIGVADVLALSSAGILDWNFRRRVGSPSYLRSLPLVASVAAALALSEFTRWAALLPLLALVWPGTWRRLNSYLPNPAV